MNRVHFIHFRVGLTNDNLSQLLLLLFQAFSDHLDTMSRRMGFVPLPLAVLLIRVVTQSLRLTSPLSYIIVLILYLWSVVM